MSRKIRQAVFKCSCRGLGGIGTDGGRCISKLEVYDRGGQPWLDGMALLTPSAVRRLQALLSKYQRRARQPNQESEPK